MDLFFSELSLFVDYKMNKDFFFVYGRDLFFEYNKKRFMLKNILFLGERKELMYVKRRVDEIMEDIIKGM